MYNTYVYYYIYYLLYIYAILRYGSISITILFACYFLPYFISSLTSVQTHLHSLSLSLSHSHTHTNHSQTFSLPHFYSLYLSVFHTFSRYFYISFFQFRIILLPLRVFFQLSTMIAPTAMKRIPPIRLMKSSRKERLEAMR